MSFSYHKSSYHHVLLTQRKFFKYIFSNLVTQAAIKNGNGNKNSYSSTAFQFWAYKKSDFSNEETLLRKTVTGVTNQRCAWKKMWKAKTFLENKEKKNFCLCTQAALWKSSWSKKSLGNSLKPLYYLFSLQSGMVKKLKWLTLFHKARGINITTFCMHSEIFSLSYATYLDI